jgi:hypothetical protein
MAHPSTLVGASRSVGLRVAVDGADVDSVVEGVLSAVGTEPHPTSRVWVHAPRPVVTADSGSGPPATYMSNPTADERPPPGGAGDSRAA